MDADKTNIPAMSLHLSRTLDDIGLNSLTVKRRRKAFLVIEQMLTWQQRINGITNTHYYFGSQTEGATTIGLDSDVDVLICRDDFNVVQEMAEWERGKANFLMLHENTAPGYCRLQWLRSDNPVARDDLPNEHLIYDDKGRVILKNTINQGPANRERNGPAVTINAHDCTDHDIVVAFKCNTWPAQAKEFTMRPRRHGWPSQHLLEEAVQHGVFLVEVGHKLSPTEALEWRISASMAERCLMFSLTIVHIKCYVILKMLVKTFIEPHVEKCISSYHCKTALFHCTENTEATFWRDENLMQCVVRCLETLRTWVTDGFCPHFILLEENLFAGKVTVHNKDTLRDIITDLIRRNGHALLQVHLDDLGQKLQTKLSTDPSDIPVLDSPATVTVIGWIEYSLHMHILINRMDIIFMHINMEHVTLICLVCQKLDLLKDRIIQSSDKHELEAIRFTIEFLSCWLGSLRASVTLSENRRIPPEALQLLLNDTNIDGASMLKLASICFCNGDLRKVETILQSVEVQWSSNKTVQWCGCGCFEQSLRLAQDVLLNTGYALKGMKARAMLLTHCVTFAPQELHCAPRALRIELHRAVGDDGQHRVPVQDRWMDLAVVDCLPYLYFLQYLTARQQGKQDIQSRSLQNLDRCVREDHGFHHLETAWNLLGQCNEHELKPDAAMACYRKSLKIRPRNNAARWHIAILCFRLIQQRQARYLRKRKITS